MVLCIHTLLSSLGMMFILCFPCKYTRGCCNKNVRTTQENQRLMCFNPIQTVYNSHATCELQLIIVTKHAGM